MSIVRRPPSDLGEHDPKRALEELDRAVERLQRHRPAQDVTPPNPQATWVLPWPSAAAAAMLVMSATGSAQYLESRANVQRRYLVHSPTRTLRMFARGTLNRTASRNVLEHLKECSLCRAEADALRAEILGGG